jgi:hypothetical protein
MKSQHYKKILTILSFALFLIGTETIIIYKIYQLEQTININLNNNTNASLSDINNLVSNLNKNISISLSDQNNLLIGLQNKITFDRRMHESAAKLMFPTYDALDLALLRDYEIDTTARPLEYMPIQIPPSLPIFEKAVPVTSSKENIYQFFLDGVWHKVPVDTSLAIPGLKVIIPEENQLHPIVTLTGAEGKNINYYFEFDVVPTFDSSFYWQIPTLGCPGVSSPNTTVKKGFTFDVYYSHLSEEDGRSLSVVFPFSVAAMRNIQESGLNMLEFDRLALILGHNNSPEATIREVFEYTKRVINRATTDTELRGVESVFKTGFGGCGHMNTFAGELLERNGIHFRLLAGFNPKVRVFYPGAGHTTAEIKLPNAENWSYFDPYLNIYLPGWPVSRIINENKIKIQAIDFDDIRFNYGNTKRHDYLFKELLLHELFKYYVYYDNKNRAYNFNMFNIFGRDHLYGVDWELPEVAPEAKQSYMPETVTIFVRARYMVNAYYPVTHGRSSLPAADTSGATAFSPWAEMSFTVQIPK